MACHANERNAADTGSSDSENQDDGNAQNAAQSDSDNSGDAGEDELPYDKLKEALEVKKLEVTKLSDELVSLDEHMSDHIETIEADLERKTMRARGCLRRTSTHVKRWRAALRGITPRCRNKSGHVW